MTDLSYAPSGALHDVVGLTHGSASLHRGLLSQPPSGGRRIEAREDVAIEAVGMALVNDEVAEVGLQPVTIAG